MSDKTTKPDTGAAEAGAVTVEPVGPQPNIFTTDAQARMGALRAMSADFPDEADARPLTPGEMAVARRTPLAALEKALVLAEAAPPLGAIFPELTDVRHAIAFELAYAGVRDEARAFARHADQAILRKKYKAVVAIRCLSGVSQRYGSMDAAEPLRLHIADLKRALSPRRKPAATAPKPEEKK